ncbi:pantoate--beta-alanine ligase [Marinospirillum insulare]|uniref:Pantothenate synthetase n=1 Tax=Marinospirillum insulare TaxID=217169 RepID=A0ABQ5ZV70_9GAMM|nr:pantoate--beta-alanine ligase [Marinospirillum insulare]GLR64059.1 pantothenate synthetase [Marinospirillum insulare]
MKAPLKTLVEISQLREELAACRAQGKKIALVPTMGNLHQGHLRLVEEAKRHADFIVASIFVNPLQFNPDEDYESYPRTLAEDQTKLASAGCDLLFTPSVEVVYPNGQENQTRVVVPGVSEGLCGQKRPGHFDGVATIVTKLFNFVQPDVACFGQKDYQQLSVIRKLVEDLSFAIKIIDVPTHRTPEGLALSSRNNYLTPEQLAKAPTLYATLKEAAKELAAGNTHFNELNHQARARLAEQGFAPEYVEIRNLDLSPASLTANTWVILIAARLGKTRLIDNLIVQRDSN